MTGARDITQLCFSSNLAGIIANNIEESFYSVYSSSGTESIKRALSILVMRYKTFSFEVANKLKFEA